MSAMEWWARWTESSINHYWKQILSFEMCRCDGSSQKKYCVPPITPLTYQMLIRKIEFYLFKQFSSQYLLTCNKLSSPAVFWWSLRPLQQETVPAIRSPACWPTHWGPLGWPTGSSSPLPYSLIVTFKF